MRSAVRHVFVRFTDAFEGTVAFMYLDVKGLVTTAIGCLIDPCPEGFDLERLHEKYPEIEGVLRGLPLVRRDGLFATPQEKLAEWLLVKRHPTAAKAGHHRALERATNLRLTTDGIRELVDRRLDLNEQLLAKRFPDWNDWPADAQLATHSMAWACGPYFQFPRMERALRAGAFLAASHECRIQEAGNPGVIPRNLANRTLYRNAALVMSQGFDRETLFWPTALTDERPTERELENPPSSEPSGPVSPKVVIDAAIVHPKVKLGRPALDGDDE